MKRLALLVSLFVACGSKKQSNDGAYPVGLTMGGGAVIVGPSTCTYEAPVSVARLGADHKTAELVGEGAITETCGDARRTFDVLKPTAVRIDGPAKVKVGATSENQFVATLLAGARTLSGVTSSNAQPMWTQGADCKDTASFGAVLGSQDTGGQAITRNLVTAKAGACTIHVELLGQRGNLTVAIE